MPSVNYLFFQSFIMDQSSWDQTLKIINIGNAEYVISLGGQRGEICALSSHDRAVRRLGHFVKLLVEPSAAPNLQPSLDVFDGQCSRDKLVSTSADPDHDAAAPHHTGGLAE